jgi:hypothetical protein
VVVALALAFPAVASAQSDAARAAARDLGADGVEDFQAGKYADASQKLGKAFDILKAPSLGLWSARALAKMGKLLEASERYLDVTRLDARSGDIKVQEQAKADAAAEREALLPRIPSLTIEVKGGGPELVVSLDGTQLQTALLGVKQPANPGAHVIEAKDGARIARKEITLAEGQKQQLTLDLGDAPAGAAPSETGAAPAETAPTPGGQPQADAPVRPGLPPGFWVGVAVAGAGVLTGSITAGLASSKKSDLGCPDDRCAPSQKDEVDAHNQLLTISTIGFVAAGVGAATAGVFLLTRPKAAPQARSVTPWVGVGSAGVSGTF